MKKGHNRRKYFIKSDLQGRLVLSCLLFIAGCSLLFFVLLGILSLDSLSAQQIDQSIVLKQPLTSLLKQLLTSNWFLIVAGGGCMLVAILLLSHRVAGPLYRFETTLDNMKKGQLDNTIHLRDKDEGKELAQKINQFNVQLTQTFRHLSQHSRALQVLIEQSSTLDLPEEEKERLASLCWSMQEHNRKIAKSCDYFNTRD